jgi:hypothetical protein
MADEEAVGEGGEGVVVGERVGGAHAHAQGHCIAVCPRRKVRSLSRPSSVLRMAVEPRNTSSRKATSASGSMPAVSTSTTPSRSRRRSTGPKSSLGSVKRPRRYSKYRPAERPRSAPRGLGLGGAGRADDEHVLARDGGEGDELDEGLALDEAATCGWPSGSW